jgi:hypothetical protein
VRNNSLKKTARYQGEKPPRPDLPKREELEETSRRFAVKYLLAVMNSSAARNFLRANRRSNIHLYPDDWKKLPIPDVTANQQQPIVALVDEILAAKRANLNADIKAMEADLDAKVNALYGIAGTAPATLSPDEDASLKEFLRVKCLPDLRERHTYFSINTIRDYLKSHHKKPQGATLKLYLSELVAGLFVFDAGKGWYTFVNEPFKLEPAPTTELVGFLEKKYPLLDFACWSTEQVKSHAHLMLTRFISFVNVERHNMTAVFESLRDAGWNAYLDPSANEAGKTFAVREKTVVVRPSISRQPVSGKLATIEKVLVDLYVECGQLPLIDIAEYRRMFSNLTISRRIDVAILSQYAHRRNVQVKSLFNPDEHTIATF